MLIQQPLVAANRTGQYDMICTVSGGGLSGQAGAVRHGIVQGADLFRAGPARRAQARRLPHPRLAAWSSARSTASAKARRSLPVLQALIGVSAQKGRGALRRPFNPPAWPARSARWLRPDTPALVRPRRRTVPPKMNIGTPWMPASFAAAASARSRHVLVAGERRAHVVGIEPDVGRRLHQHLAVDEVGALGEIEIHQPLLHLGALPIASAQRMRRCASLVFGWLLILSVA